MAATNPNSHAAARPRCTGAHPSFTIEEGVRSQRHIPRLRKALGRRLPRTVRRRRSIRRPDPGIARAIRKRVEQLARDLNEPELSSGFAIAESFHKIFYHGMMEEHELELDFPKVERLVNRLLALNGQQGNGQGTVR